MRTLDNRNVSVGGRLLQISWPSQHIQSFSAQLYRPHPVRALRNLAISKLFFVVFGIFVWGFLIFVFFILKVLQIVEKPSLLLVEKPDSYYWLHICLHHTLPITEQEIPPHLSYF